MSFDRNVAATISLLEQISSIDRLCKVETFLTKFDCFIALSLNYETI